MNMRSTKVVLFFAILALGVATIVRTVVAGGSWNSQGVLLGGILCVMALMRLYLTFRHEA